MKYTYDYCKKLKRWPLVSDIADEASDYTGRELSYLTRLGFTDDSSAWALKYMRIDYGVKGPVFFDHYTEILRNKKVVRWAHSFAQNHPAYGPRTIANALRGLATGIELSRKDWETLFKQGWNENAAMYLATNGQYSQWDNCVVQYCSSSMLRRPFDLVRAAMLLRDTNTHGRRFNSMKELKAEHDRQAEAYLEAEAAKKRIAKLSYTEEFERLVEECGFTLPHSTKDFVDRGREHHNCVANYILPHCTNNPSKAGYAGMGLKYFARILLRPESTLEINFFCDWDRIMTIGIIQHLGNRNTKVEEKVDISPLFALKGRNIDCITTFVEDVDDLHAALYGDKTQEHVALT